MSQTNINRTVADALEWHMKKAGVTAQQLGQRAGVSDRTVGNFLNPERRTGGSKGKEPSGKLTELALIAQALGVHFVDLVTEATPDQREEKRRLAMAAHVLRTGQLPEDESTDKLTGARGGTPSPQRELVKAPDFEVFFQAMNDLAWAVSDLATGRVRSKSGGGNNIAARIKTLFAVAGIEWPSGRPLPQALPVETPTL